MAAIGERVGLVLGCGFAPSHDPNDSDKLILQAETFCLRLTISQGRFRENSAMRIYQLNGENIIEPRWDYSEEINLSEWILQELRRRDSPDWYIPTLEELKNEAGIS